MTEQAESPAGSFSAWLRNAVLAALIVLLGMCCYFVYRLAMVAYRVEESIVAVSTDVKQVTSTVAVLSGDVSAIREDIANLKQKAQESLPYEEARHAFEEALAIGAAIKADSSELSPDAEREIKALLRSLMFCGRKAEIGGHTQSVLTLYGRLYGKYKVRKNTLKSAEDFIEQIATETVLGKTYYLVDQEDNRVELSDWLAERLADMRGTQTPEQPDQTDTQ